MNLNTRDWLTIIGGCLAGVGLVFMHHIDSTTLYVTGEAFCAIGPVLIGAGRFTNRDQP